MMTNNEANATFSDSTDENILEDFHSLARIIQSLELAANLVSGAESSSVGVIGLHEMHQLAQDIEAKVRVARGLAREAMSAHKAEMLKRSK
jgi:hypothetical protein